LWIVVEVKYYCAVYTACYVLQKKAETPPSSVAPKAFAP